jgi:L-galactose dehydrogenase
VRRPGCVAPKSRCRYIDPTGSPPPTRYPERDELEYRAFGRTGLRVSTCGLGTGGESRLGLGTGATDADAASVVRRAIELGINFIDTAADYGTEEVIGRALRGDRKEVVLSSKVQPRSTDGSLLGAAALRRGVESSLRRLRTDVVDVYHLHRVDVADYRHCREELVPELLTLRGAGRIRFLAISESTALDPEHHMLQYALRDREWDAVMVGFNFLNQSARDVVIPEAVAGGVAVEVMAAARSYFSRPDRLCETVGRLVAAGEIADPGPDHRLGFLDAAGGAGQLAATAYRFVAGEPGVSVVLVGTGNVGHLEDNVNALSAGRLPADVRAHIVSLFGHLRCPLEAPWRATPSGALRAGLR